MVAISNLAFRCFKLSPSRRCCRYVAWLQPTSGIESGRDLDTERHRFASSSVACRKASRFYVALELVGRIVDVLSTCEVIINHSDRWDQTPLSL
jgi:hypothetical protein